MVFMRLFSHSTRLRSLVDNTPRILAILNSFLLALFDWLDVRNVASHMRLIAAQPFLALRLFILPPQRIK